MSAMKLVVAGANGRMGHALVKTILASDNFELVGALEHEKSDALGKDIGALVGLGECGIKVIDNSIDTLVNCEGVIDFTLPDATVELAELSAQARIVHVIGTTGFQPDQFDKLKAAARHARIVQSGNMSLGVNLLALLAKQAAAALDESFDIEILEMHHKHKVDAPSGTALLLGQAAADGRDIALEQRSVRVRDGHTGARPEGDIGFATLRGGSVVGDHSVIMAGPDEVITLSHRAEDRQIFVNGALKAATWAMPQKPGYYSMAHVLGLSDS